MSACNAGFVTMNSGYETELNMWGNHRCKLDRLHEGAHLSEQGFTWGLINGHDDPWHQRLLEYDRGRAAKRAGKNRSWYKKLAKRGWVEL